MVILHATPPLTCETRTRVNRTHRGVSGKSSFDAKVSTFSEFCIISSMDESCTCLLDIRVLL